MSWGRKTGRKRGREGGKQEGTYLDVVELVVVRDTDLVADGHAREGAEGTFEHRAGVGDVEEVHGLRTELDKRTLGQRDVFNL